jgi:hypothetical protein
MFDNEGKSQQRRKKDDLEIDSSFTASASGVLRQRTSSMTVAEQAQARQAIARLRLHRSEIMTRHISQP